MENNVSTIGSNIRKIRERLEMTQPELARLTGLTVKAISEIENGHKQPRTASIKLFAQALSCTVNDLESTVPTGNSVKQADVAASVDQLLKAVHYPAQQRTLALFFLTGKDAYLDEYLEAEKVQADTGDAFDLHRALRALQKLIT